MDLYSFLLTTSARFPPSIYAVLRAVVRHKGGSMKRKPKLDLECIVHWLIGIAVAAGALGLLLQIVRWGTIVEAGSIGPAGF